MGEGMRVRIAEAALARPSEPVRADVAVIGAGPAGIAAAVRAAEAGGRVLLLDEGMRPGGQIWRHRSREGLPAPARRWLARLDASSVETLFGASVIDAASGFRLTAQRRGEALTIEAPRVILATGARERFLPFPGWTLPGVIGVGGAQALLKSGASFTGRRVIVAGSGPLLLPVAAALAADRARIVAVLEQAPPQAVLRFGAGLWRSPAKLAQAARYRRAFRPAAYRWGAWVVRADGDATVREVAMSDGRCTWTERCDTLCTGFGLVPNTQLARLLGCDVRGGAVRVDAMQRTTTPGVFCAGEPTGIAGVEAAVVEGEIAGYTAGGLEHAATGRLAARDRQRRFASRLEAAFALREALRSLPEPDTILCRCEDVACGRLRPEWDARQAKLYTRTGMGPCQARVCGPALQYLFGWAPDSTRPPVAPTAVATLTLLPDDVSGDAR